MREIKFRAWDKKKREMKLVTNLEWNWQERKDEIHLTAMAGEMWDGTPIEYDIKNNLIVMLYTGLHDKNGKEIYEGDIITFETESEGKCIEQVFWNEKEMGWYHTYSDRPIKKFWNTEIEIEVIGNIYENPELLEDKNETTL